ncbi:MAG TPA: extracellular solute-binding protein [Candidatus Omnitrophota bacterium]|nr:extracellular solute-binding protein [Candidatus Omnitrophota bacterium]
MKHTLKNFIIFFLLLTLAGCGTADKNDANTLTVWHWMSDRDETFQELAQQYQAKTGIKVKFELYAPSEAYSQRVKASAQTDTLPDIFGVLGESRDFASFVKSGFVADLTGPLSTDDGAGKWKDRLFQKALSVNEFKEGNEYGVPPGYYGIPLDITTIQMLYNKGLYRKAGLDPNVPPDSWEMFIEHCRVLREKGIPRFVSGFGEIWMIDALASNFAMNIMGEKKVFDTYAGKVPYTDPGWVKVLSLFKEMAEEKILVEGAVTMVNKTAEQTFANERAAYAFNGSWSVNVYKGMNPNLDYAAILPPKITNLNPMRIWGGAGGSFVVNDHSPRKESAIQFLQWLTEDAQQAYLSTHTENLPANKHSLKQISPILAQFADDMDNTTHPNVYPVHELPVVTEAFDKGIQSILIGEKTPEAVAAEVQKIKEKELKKTKP